MRPILVLGPILAVASAANARAQGSDDCATASPISGPGTFAVTTVGATDSAQQSGACVVAHRDVWFAWTAPQSGTVTVQTCGGATVDTLLAAYAGPGCPTSGTELACNDDSCALQSSIQFTASSGSVYLIQLGAYGAATTWTGTFTIAQPIPPANDACAAAAAISGPGPFAFDTSFATTGTEGQANPLCGSPAGIDRDVWFSWTAAATTSMELSTCGAAAFDTKVAVYAGSGCPTSAAIACNDDACTLQSRAYFDAVAGSTYTIHVGSYPGAVSGPGTFTIVPGTNPSCPGPSSGPDVIVGNITDVLNAPAAGGLDALSLGTTACNVGDAGLNWYANSTLHPVIATNLYRYSIVDGAGRFEQVGLSWLKHGYAAAVANSCCVCQNPGNSQILGVGCADTYGASLNGSQASLGPRWQVNAHTGVFTYPQANPTWSGSTARRCEVALADLTPTGGTTHYFGECTYITPDDAAANSDNNTSYKEVAVSGGPADYTFATSGGIQRMIPAIRAWAVHEPGVTITDARVPGEGLFVVGSHATALGGGLYHYEFAVFNQNSDRGAASISVPIPAGALVTNIGFRDVMYRNGDGPGNVNVDGGDWTTTQAGGFLTWSASTGGAIPGPNAIRWGTLYNFRFDADVPPASGSVELGLWKTGTPAALLVAAEIPSGGPAALGFCFGDGSAAPCPCGNQSPVGADAGCLNSFGTGAALRPAGTASVTADTFTLLGSGMPNGTALYFQGTAQQGGGVGSAFGDGLRCAGGSVVRLGTRTNSAGASQFPSAGDPAISAQTGNVAGDVRTYQCWYRNAAAFCNAERFNLSNGLQATWAP